MIKKIWLMAVSLLIIAPAVSNVSKNSNSPPDEEIGVIENSQKTVGTSSHAAVVLHSNAFINVQSNACAEENFTVTHWTVTKKANIDDAKNVGESATLEGSWAYKVLSSNTGCKCPNETPKKIWQSATRAEPCLKNNMKQNNKFWPIAALG
ncbi:hypothetical protein KC901_02515 [Patescibacteria group bacterium]|nr:hypothetical protein [Patescibacteria group bacterium]